MDKHINIIVDGRVQGVSFRKSAQEEAKRLGIRGYARNTSDGRVVIEAEGEKRKVNEFLDWCRRGPRFAQVERTDFQYSDRMRNFHDFSTC